MRHLHQCGHRLCCKVTVLQCKKLSKFNAVMTPRLLLQLVKLIARPSQLMIVFTLLSALQSVM